jgi:two-component system nitrogen regulation sensor histidine kinase NtrY
MFPWRRIGAFEWKIILALLVTAAAPLIFTLLMIGRLVEESMAIGINRQVLTALRDEVDLYKEAIESRMRIVRLQGQAMVRDPAFQKEVGARQETLVRERLQELLSNNPWITQVRVLIETDTPLAAVHSSTVSAEKTWKSKVDRWPIIQGYFLELTFGISGEFLEKSDKLRELVQTVETLSTNFQPLKIGYYRNFLYIYIWILVAAVLFGGWLSRRVTKRINALARATRQAGAGNLAVRVPSNSRDEIGLLAQSFNSMLDEIQRSRDRIVYLEKVSSWQEIARRLAHEIKNPLTPIQLVIQELHRSYHGGDQIFTKKLKDAVEIVEEEVGALRGMVETFSEFAKMPAAAPTPGELNSFVADFLKYNPHLAERVEFKPYYQPVRVELDRILMNRVLINLVSNALEASDEQDHVRIEIGDDERGFGTLSVIDYGRGLSPEARERIFQPYFTTKATGTGLGLAIVKKIILQHGGEISVVDGEQRGTVFIIRLRSQSA